MKSVLLPFYSIFKKYAVLTVFIALFASSASAQELTQTLASNEVRATTPVGALASPAVDRSKYGTFVEKDDKIVTYISKRGIVINVGDTIQLNAANRMDGRYFEIRETATNGHNKLNPNSEHLTSEYTNETFVVTGISNSSAALFGGKKNAYIFFKIPGSGPIGYGEISVEAALAKNEFEVVK